MLSRRQFLLLTGEFSIALACAGCAASPPLRKDVFADFGDSRRPYLGLATSLPEEHRYEARVVGSIPAEVRGTLYRNGPGLFDRGGLRKRNLLDGDGMVQAFRFHDNGVQYQNRFVRTDKFIDEEKAGRFIYQSWSTQAPGGFWKNFAGAGDLKGQAGITVFPWQGRLYAFDECAYPYELDPDTLETVGLTHLGLPEDLTIYAAHAKFDPLTGEWLHFGVRYGPSPKLHITVFNSRGGLKNHRVIPMQHNIYMHDWSISSRYLILTLHPVEIAFSKFLMGRRSLADSLRWKPEQGNKIMVIEREGDAPPLVLEGAASYMWHSCNAHEREGMVIADFIGYSNPDHFVGRNPVVTAAMTGRSGEHAHPGKVRRYLIDLATKSLREETVYGGNCEWPRVNEQHRGQSYRYGYMVKTRPKDFFWTIMCRIDMLTGRTETYDFGADSYCGEPVFIPLPGKKYSGNDLFEPGFLMTEVYDSSTRKSYLALLKADRITDGPVAEVHLKHHVPFSYHGWWCAAS